MSALLSKAALQYEDALGAAHRAIALNFGPTMTKPRIWERLHLSPWGRVKAMADHLGFKVQRLKTDQCRLFMANVEVKDILTNTDLTDNLANIEALLREAVEERDGIPEGRKKSR